MNGPTRLQDPRQPAFPAYIAKLASRLPTWPHSAALSVALNLALDRILPRDSMEPLRGKRVRIRFSDSGLAAQVLYDGRWFRPEPAAGHADVIVSAAAHDFRLLATRREDADTLFFARRLVMEGDTDAGLVVKNTLDAVDWPRLEPADFLPHRALPKLASLLTRKR